jgi:hypothetical protein
MNQAQNPQSAKQFLHYNLERTDYSIPPEELARLESAGSNLWKDICLISGPLGLSCIIYACAATSDPFKLNLALFLNYLFGVVGILLSIVFGIAWSKSYTQFSSIIDKIKNKPKMEIIPSTTNVGALAFAPPPDKNNG